MSKIITESICKEIVRKDFWVAEGTSNAFPAWVQEEIFEDLVEMVYRRITREIFKGATEGVFQSDFIRNFRWNFLKKFQKRFKEICYRNSLWNCRKKKYGRNFQKNYRSILKWLDKFPECNRKVFKNLQKKNIQWNFQGSYQINSGQSHGKLGLQLHVLSLSLKLISLTDPSEMTSVNKPFIIRESVIIY